MADEITKQQLQDAGTDAQNLAKAVNDPFDVENGTEDLGTFTDRDGDTHKNLQRHLKDVEDARILVESTLVQFGKRLIYSDNLTESAFSVDGELRFNHADPGGATEAYIVLNDKSGTPILSHLQYATENPGGQFFIALPGVNSTEGAFKILSHTVESPGGGDPDYHKLSIEPRGSSLVLTDGDDIYFQGIRSGAEGSVTGALLVANNLSDLQNLATALANLGLNNVDNTADIDKPISDATQTALNNKAASATAARTNITNTFEKTQVGEQVDVVFAANVAVDFNDEPIKKIILTGALTLDAPTNIIANGVYKIHLVMDGTGGHAVSYNTIFDFEDVTPFDTSALGANEAVTLFLEANHDASKLITTARKS